jgi:hypothetical protein
MKYKTSLPKKKVEHRGYDVSATKNFDLEMKIVREFNSPSKAGSHKSAKNKSLK